jgi:hypothetical protein
VENRGFTDYLARNIEAQKIDILGPISQNTFQGTLVKRERTFIAPLFSENNVEKDVTVIKSEFAGLKARECFSYRPSFLPII